MDVRLRRISSLLGWTFELALALPISRRRFESRLVGLHVPNCELFAGRSRYRERASRRWLAPLRASGPPGWRLVHSVKGGPVSPTADGEDTPYFRRCAPAKTRPDVAVSPEHWPSPSRSADAAQVCREGRLRSAQGAVLHVGPSANAPRFLLWIGRGLGHDSTQTPHSSFPGPHEGRPHRRPAGHTLGGQRPERTHRTEQRHRPAS